MRERILVIRLGALGDFILSMGAFAAIRKHHPTARITLLTTPPYRRLGHASPYFNTVWTDQRPRWWQFRRLRELRERLLEGYFSRVYDLQTSDRSSAYFHLMGPRKRPEWSGIARGCSHPDDNPERTKIHTIERQREQLKRAGITEVPLPDLSWMTADISQFKLKPPYVLLVPGGAPHRPGKRWPLGRYIEIAGNLAKARVKPVIIGGPPERAMGREIVAACPKAHSLVGETRYDDIVEIARGAKLAIGNDTGPMHLIAAAGCPTLVLFSHESDPVRTAPRAPEGAPPVTVLRRQTLEELPLDEVWAATQRLLKERSS
jgi:ADP-heptose:LPS heptosyltransferase